MANRCPGGESGNDFAARVLREFKNIEARGGVCLLDEHGGGIQLSADFVGAVLAREAHAVVIAHRALDEVDFARRIGEHGGEILPAEKAV